MTTNWVCTVVQSGGVGGGGRVTTGHGRCGKEHDYVGCATVCDWCLLLSWLLPLLISSGKEIGAPTGMDWCHIPCTAGPSTATKLQLTDPFARLLIS